MITRQQVDQLLQFQNGDHLVTSCYLNLDRAKMPAQMLKIRTKDLLQAAHQELAGKAGRHAQRESLRRDFERIETFVMDEVMISRHRALAIFACSGHKFWQTYGLPRLVRNILIADHEPYLHPLTAMLAEHHRYATILVDRSRAEVYEVYMGAIDRHAVIDDAVPRRVREGGYGGREEHHSERRHTQAVQKHYQHLAAVVRDLVQQQQIDWLVLAGQREVLCEFKHELHPQLRRRWAGDAHLDPATTTPADLLRETLTIEEAVEWAAEQRLADELIAKVEAGDLAVRGVTDTVQAVGRGEARLLLVDHEFEMPGYACFQCHYPTLEPENCPHCQQPTQPCADIVDEVLELALQRNCQVEHLHGPTPLREAGRIGALLRYQA